MVVAVAIVSEDVEEVEMDVAMHHHVYSNSNKTFLIFVSAKPTLSPQTPRRMSLVSLPRLVLSLTHTKLLTPQGNFPMLERRIDMSE